MPLSCSIFFCILTLSLLPSSGSKFPFDALGCFGVSSIPAFFEEVSLSFYFYLPVSSLLCFSISQLLFDILRLYNSNVLLLFFLLSSWFHQCTFSGHSVYLGMTPITP